MRIAFLHTAFTTCGGIERVWIEKMNYLTTHFGHDIFMVTSDQGSHPIPFPVDEKVRLCDMDIRMYTQYKYRGLRRLKERRRLSQLYEQRLRQMLADIRPDILVCTSTQDMRQLLRVRGSVPVIVESHLNFSHPGTLWNRLLTRYNNHYIGKAEAVVTLTDGDARNWRRVSKNVHVIPNIVHLNDTGTYGDCISKKAVFIGRLAKEKALDDMAHIWRQVNTRSPDWQLHLYGDGTMDSQPAIQLFVHPATTEPFERYKESSILLLTSHFESFGLVLPEAMSCGIPVVSYDCPYGPASIITDGKDGFLVPNRDEHLYVERVAQLISDADLRRNMGQQGIVSAQRYRAEAIMQQWEELYQSLLFK